MGLEREGDSGTEQVGLSDDLDGTVGGGGASRPRLWEEKGTQV